MERCGQNESACILPLPASAASRKKTEGSGTRDKKDVWVKRSGFDKVRGWALVTGGKDSQPLR